MKNLTKALVTMGVLLVNVPLFAQPEDGLDFTVNRYASARGWDVNAYWLVAENGVVLIDALLRNSDAMNMVALIRATGKPLRGVVLTHPHPDHYGGLQVLREELGEFPVYATQATADTLSAVHEEFMQNVDPQMKDDIYTVLVRPDHIVASGETVEIAGIPLLFDDLGPGEAPDNAVIYQPNKKILFTGDSTMHHKHYYIGEGRSKRSLEQLHYMKEHYSDATVFLTGHGDPARPSILDQHIEYIETFRLLLRDTLADSANLTSEKDHLTEAAREIYAKTIIDQYPYLGDYGFDAARLIIFFLPKVETEILAEGNAATN